MKIPAIPISKWSPATNDGIYRRDGYVGIWSSDPQDMIDLNGKVLIGIDENDEIFIRDSRGDARYYTKAQLDSGTLDGQYAPVVTVMEHYRQHGEAIQIVLKDLDGYRDTINEHYTQHSDAFDTIRKDLDGYRDTINEHYTQHSNAFDTIRKDLDGYALLNVENQRWVDSSQQRQALRDAADGYQAQINNTLITVSEHYAQHSDAIVTVRKDLDGYNQTISEHYVQHSIAIDTVRKDLDGYRDTINEHYTQHSDAFDTIRKDLDGYAVLSPPESASDGYVAFFTSSTGIAGDNDFYWDRVNNRLGIHTTNPTQFLQIGERTSLSTTSPDSISIGATYSSVAGMNPKLRFYDQDNGNYMGFGTSSSQFDFMMSNLAWDYVWYADGTEYMRLDPTLHRLTFGGTTSSFPAIKRSGTDIQLRLGDDSDYTNLITEGITAYGEVGVGTAIYSVGGLYTSPLLLYNASNHVISAITTGSADKVAAFRFDNDSADKHWQIGIRGSSDNYNFRLAHHNGTSWETAAIEVDVNNNVGFGTEVPGNKIDIITGATTDSAVHMGEVANEGMYFTSLLDSQGIISAGSEYVSGSWIARATEQSTMLFQNGIVAFRTDGSLVDGNAFSPTERARISSSGDFLINTTSVVDSSILTVNGTVSASNPISDTHLTTKAYVDALVQGLDWQDSVKDKDLDTPPVSPVDGYRYIVAFTAVGDWENHEEEIAEYNGSGWDFIEPSEGTAVWVEDENVLYTYNASFPDGYWVRFGSTVDHGNLLGLTDDDHWIYLHRDGTREMTGSLKLGGITSSYPSIKHNGTTLEVRLADDSALTDLSASRVIVPLHSDSSTPEIAFGDGDTGFYESVDDIVVFSSAGTSTWSLSGSTFRVTSNIPDGPQLDAENATNTNPTLLPSRSDNNTGIGWAGGDTLSLITGALEGLRITNSGGTALVGFEGASYTDPAMRREGANVWFRKGDDSEFTSIACANIDAYGTDIGFGLNDTSDVTIRTGGGDIRFANPIVSGTFEAPEDAGPIIVMDMPVSSTPSAGEEMSMGFAIDANTIFTAYAEADGSGGVQNLSLNVANDLDVTGDITVGGTVAGINIAENAVSQDLAIQTIRKDLDGYRDTINEHYTQHSDAFDTIRKDLDGYAVLPPSASAADGYVAFFTGSTGIAGDSDLYWDRENNRLGIHSTSPTQFLQVGERDILQTPSPVAISLGATYSNVVGENLKLYLYDRNNGDHIGFGISSGQLDSILSSLGSDFVWYANSTEYMRLDPALHMLTFGGTSDAYPAIKRVGRDIYFRVADDSDYTSITCANIDAYGHTLQLGLSNTDDVMIDTGGGDIILNKSLIVGNTQAPTDAGPIIVMDMPVSSTPSAGEEMSMGFAIDAETIFTSYAEADGSGGVQNTLLKVDSGQINFNGVASTDPAITGVGRDVWFRTGDNGDFTSIAIDSLDAYGNILLHEGLIQFGGTSAVDPAIKRMGEDVHFVKADDSAFTSIAVANIDAYGTDIGFGLNDTSDVTIRTGGGDIIFGSPIQTGLLEAPTDAGPIIVMDMPVSSTPSAGDEMSMGFAVDANTIFTAYAEADGSGGVQEVKLRVDGYFEPENNVRIKRTATASDYYCNGQEYLIAVTDTSSARIVFLPDAVSADENSFIIKDESGNAGTNNITIQPADAAQTIDGAASIAITTNYGSTMVYSNGTAWFSVMKDL